MGAALSFLGQKLFASSTLISARFENISCASGAQCCTSVAAVHPPVVRRTGGFLRKGMTTIYVDSRKRVAGSDSDFEVDLGESLHLQSDARLAVYKIRLADSFLSTDRGRYLWVDAALVTLNWALLPEGAYTGARLARRVRPGVLGPQRSGGVRKLNFYHQVQLRRQHLPAAQDAHHGGSTSA